MSCDDCPVPSVPWCLSLTSPKPQIYSEMRNENEGTTRIK